jgi:hypothetical protein
MLCFRPLGRRLLLRRLGSFGLRRLLRHDVKHLRKLVREPDQDGGFKNQDHCVDDNAAEIAPTGIYRGRVEEIQREVMQRDRAGADENRPKITVGSQTGKRGEEIHVHVDLPRMPRHLIDEQRNTAHQCDGNGAARRNAAAADAPGPCRCDRQNGHQRGRHDPVHASRETNRQRQGKMQPEQDQHSLAGRVAQCFDGIALAVHSEHHALGSQRSQIVKHAPTALGSIMNQAPAWFRRSTPPRSAGRTTRIDDSPPALTIEAPAAAAAASDRSVVHQGGKTAATTSAPGRACATRTATHTQLKSNKAIG